MLAYRVFSMNKSDGIYGPIETEFRASVNATLYPCLNRVYILC
jgi:hypothetical protein